MTDIKTTSKRHLREVVALTQDCDIGKQGERAVVVSLEATQAGVYMTVVFPDRSADDREVCTGADYVYFKSV